MKTKLELIAEKETLQLERMKLDRLFSMYLDKFGAKMDPKKPNTKIWELYRAKMTEYGELATKIRTLEYWISK